MTRLRACLKECHAEFFSKCGPLLGTDCFLFKAVRFVSNEYFFDILAGMQFDLADPVPHVGEGVFLSAIVG